MHRVSFVAFLAFLAIGGSGDAWGWGGTAHKFINQNAVQHLPPLMSQLAAQQQFLAAHASDADYRKGADTAEAPKHFLDLEAYPDFQHLTPELSTLVAQYGWPTVKANGILPWATVWALDSLTEQFRRRDWSRAYQTAADLGHYVGDAHQPLHCTVNYNGYQTGNSGIHSRYETDLINQYQSFLSVSPDSAHLITDSYAFALQYILHANSYVDSIMQADTRAKAGSGWNGTGTPPSSYYALLWQYTGSFTEALIQQATRDLASLWYTAWVNAGLAEPASVAEERHGVPRDVTLLQNWPNPWNPSTTIGYTVGVHGSEFMVHGTEVKLVVYDLLGREVAVLVDEKQAPGRYTVRFDAGRLASGVYLYRLQAGSYVETRRMVLLR